jgi:single-strand DNA-binding protein
MNDATMTLAGNVVDEPRMRRTKSGHMVTNFRLASTARRKDLETGNWLDISTIFVTVTCWRAMAENVAASLHKGQPVVVTGRYYAREYEINESVRVSYELEATAVGHDLSRGTTEFQRVSRANVPNQIEIDAEGIPAERSDVWLDLVEPDSSATDSPAAPAGASPAAGSKAAGSRAAGSRAAGSQTAEVRELASAS